MFTVCHICLLRCCRPRPARLHAVGDIENSKMSPASLSRSLAHSLATCVTARPPAPQSKKEERASERERERPLNTPIGRRRRRQWQSASLGRPSGGADEWGAICAEFVPLLLSVFSSRCPASMRKMRPPLPTLKCLSRSASSFLAQYFVHDDTRQTVSGAMGFWTSASAADRLFLSVSLSLSL